LAAQHGGMFRIWLAEGTSHLLTTGMPAVVAAVPAGALVLLVDRVHILVRQLTSLRPTPLLVGRVLLPATTARGRAAARRGR
jgi:hypothetical protein